MNEKKNKSIIDCREIKPLLAKAGQILSYYTEALDCPAAVLDEAGFAVSTPWIKKQMDFCKYCKNHFCKLTDGNRRDGIDPCGKTHQVELAKSRRIEGPYIYSCPSGYVYWTSPLFSKGRYVGALIAGQVLPNEKNAEEIEAKAVLLSVCAEEIPESKDEPGDVMRRMIRRGEGPEPTAGPRGRGSLSEETISARAGKKPQDPDKWHEDSEQLMEKERLLFAAFRRGDNDTGGKILEELMDSITSFAPRDIELARFRAMELVVLLSRSAAGNAVSDETHEANNRHLKRILESKNMEEITGNLRIIAERMAGRMFSFKGVRHASVLRRAERFIWENYTRKLTLEEIAKYSGLSAPYFSTVFKEEMGENLSSYLNRLRVEKAANLLTATSKPLDQIAKLCGFEDQSWFSKIFKSYTGVSPGKFRETGNGVLAFANINSANNNS